MKRWAWIVRRGIDVRGYPHQSPEQERVPGIDCCRLDLAEITIEDQDTVEFMKTLSKRYNRIARLKWSQGYSHADIARLLNTTESKINYGVDMIRDKVADAVLL